ncbi:hypothetical protein H6G89_10080 [Oscillatoria sp. FACHB-1407]|nr:hypothetical protein [Oscillatoria sp. FACHB-1407]
MTLLIWGVSATAAIANTWPPMAIWLLQMPLGASLLSYGVGLVAIALLEGAILWRRENLALKRSLIISAVANLYSLGLGLLAIAGFAALPYSILGTVFLGTLYVLLILASWSFVPYFQMQRLKQYPLWRTLSRLAIWGGIWFALLLSSLLLISIVHTINPRTTAGIRFPDPTVPLYVNALQLLAVMLFIGIGFAISVVSEGACLTRWLPQSSNRLWRTVLVMNLRSYAYIAVPITLLFLMSRRT